MNRNGIGRCAAASALLLAFSGPSAGAQAPSTGFVARHEITIKAPAARVYEVLTRDVGSWWSSSHTYSGDARNLSIDARAGGCFCETLPGGGSVEHLRVVHVVPGKLFRLAGGLGPLQGSGVAGSMTWTLTVVADGTKLELTYSVGGFMEGGFEKIKDPVAAVLGEQIRRLGALIETGKPAPGT